MFEKLVASIDSEVVHRIYKVAVDHQHPVAPEPVVDLSKAAEIHDEALDETALMEEAGQLISSVPEVHHEGNGETKVKVEGSSNDSGYSTPAPSINPSSGTRVTVERGGAVVAERVYGEKGELQKTHGKIGRNDPCWCGRKKPDGTPVKYKHCHYPN